MEDDKRELELDVIREDIVELVEHVNSLAAALGELSKLVARNHVCIHNIPCLEDDCPDDEVN